MAKTLLELEAELRLEELKELTAELTELLEDETLNDELLNDGVLDEASPGSWPPQATITVAKVTAARILRNFILHLIGFSILFWED